MAELSRHGAGRPPRHVAQNQATLPRVLVEQYQPHTLAHGRGHTVQLQRFARDRLFEHIFLSCELGVEKPAPEIFVRVAEGIGVPAGDILFFDDSEVNCEAARQCGLQALVAPAHSEWLKYFDENGKLHTSYVQAQP